MNRQTLLRVVHKRNPGRLGRATVGAPRPQQKLALVRRSGTFSSGGDVEPVRDAVPQRPKGATQQPHGNSNFAELLHPTDHTHSDSDTPLPVATDNSSALAIASAIAAEIRRSAPPKKISTVRLEAVLREVTGSSLSQEPLGAP